MLIQALSVMKYCNDYIPHLCEGLKCLAEHINEMEPARYEFPGGFMMLQAGTTKPLEEGDYEAHRKYLDVQVLLDGSETILWADTETLSETSAYDEAKDKVMYTGEGSTIEVRPGMCYVCWPNDAHKACHSSGEPKEYRKAVIKLAID